MGRSDALLKRARQLQAALAASVNDEMYAGMKDALLLRLEARREANKDLPPEEAAEWEVLVKHKIKMLVDSLRG